MRPTAFLHSKQPSPGAALQATLAAAALLALCVLLTTGCSGESPSEPGGATPAELVPVPSADVANLESQVQEALAASAAELETILESEASTPFHKAEAYGRHGMIHQAHNLRPTAIAAYTNSSVLAPDDHRWPGLLGRVQADEGNLDAAVSQFERALEFQPDHLPYHLYLARVHLAAERPAAARPLLERAVEIDPGSASARIDLGKLALTEKRYDEAVEQLEKALELEPRASEANYPLGLAYRGAGDEERAERFLNQRGTDRAPLEDPVMAQVQQMAGGWRVHQNRATALFEQGHYEQALGEYRLAAEAAPSEPLVRTNLGSTLTRLGRLEEAQREFETAVELDPTLAMAHFNLGTLRAQAGDAGAAVGHYQQAISHNPDHLDSHFNLANALRRLGRFEPAAPHYARVVLGDPGNAQARLGEALTLVKLGDWAGARRKLELSAEALPENILLRQCLARVLAGAPDDATRDGQRAYDLAVLLMEEDTSLDNAVTLAMAAAELGQFNNAIYMQGQAIEAAQNAGRQDLLPFLRSLEEGYRQNRPCRGPWAADDPLLAPSS